MNAVDRVLSWTAADERFVDRVSANLDEDRRAVLKAIVETRGDVRALSQRLAPEVVERLRARVPERAKMMLDRIGLPLATAWSLPAELAPEELAQQFLERYGARLDELTGAATKAATAARAGAATLQSVSASKDVAEAMASLQQQVAELRSLDQACPHPEGKQPGWTDRAEHVAREGMDTVEAARSFRAATQDLRTRCETLAATFEAWIEAPDAERAATAASLAVHVRAATAVAAEMKEQIARAVV